MSPLFFVDVDPEDHDVILGRFPHAEIVDGPLTAAQIPERCSTADAICCFITTAFPRSVLEKLPKLKLLCTRSVGYDHIDVAACRERGITVCNVPDYGSHVIAEHVFALLLSTLRHVHEGDERVHSGVFDYQGLRGMALRGKTIGIVGTGKIGRRVAEIAHGFGMTILATDQCRTLEITERFGVRYVSFDELLSASDIITLHIPGTKETEHMIDDNAFKHMKQGAVLVNTARGSLINSTAMLAALKNGRLAYALLDVLEHEQNFEENKELVQHPRVVTTPHIAFYADDSMRNMFADAFLSIEQWRSGQTPAHAVEPPTIVCDIPPIRR